MAEYPVITVDTRNPDPTQAINAFLWCMAKAKSIGMLPPTEHTLAEHLFRKSANLIHYSSMSGVTALCMDEDAMTDDDQLEMLQWIAQRRVQRVRERKAREREAATTQGIEASGEDDLSASSRSDESPVGNADAPEEASETQGDRP